MASPNQKYNNLKETQETSCKDGYLLVAEIVISWSTQRVIIKQRINRNNKITRDRKIREDR